MSNMDLWRRVCVTDPKVVKPITGKQYSGNSPKPYWIVERLTAEFGPCGTGWGFTILNERMERLTADDVLHIATVRLWYALDGKRGEVEQIGQTKACYKTGKGTILVDEDAPKKSVTDALVKCASYLGFAGDIFSGRWDDSKYVAEAGKGWEGRRQEEQRGAAQTSKQEQPEGLSDQRFNELLTGIQRSKTLGDLKASFESAVKEAREAGDRQAYDDFVVAKNKRKAEADAARGQAA